MKNVMSFLLSNKGNLFFEKGKEEKKQKSKTFMGENRGRNWVCFLCALVRSVCLFFVSVHKSSNRGIPLFAHASTEKQSEARNVDDVSFKNPEVVCVPYLLDKKWLACRFLLALFILVPLGGLWLLALLESFSGLGGRMDLLLSDCIWYSLTGVLVWGVLVASQLCHSFLLYVYVFGHELTHCIAVKLCRGHISEFRATLTGGHVVVSKNNVFIALSPYFIPIWVVVWLLFAGGVSLFLSWDDVAPCAFGGLGFWWGFHFYWTCWMIPKDQPDLRDNGRFFSLMVIYLSNLMFITISLVMFHVFSFEIFYHNLHDKCLWFYYIFRTLMGTVWGWF